MFIISLFFICKYLYFKDIHNVFTLAYRPQMYTFIYNRQNIFFKYPKNLPCRWVAKHELGKAKRQSIKSQETVAKF